MKHYLWGVVLKALDQIEARCQEERAELARRVLAQSGTRSPQLLTEAQKSVVETLKDLRTQLRHNLTEEEIYRVLFALVISLDERMWSKLFRDFEVAWPPMQEELLGVDVGGDLFFDAVDELLVRADVSPFVLEVYYYCLKSGFQGRLESQPAMIERYVSRLAARIPAPVPEAGQPPDVPLRWTESHPGWIYAAAAILVGSFYLTSWMVAR